MNDLLEQIPQSRREIAATALSAAFGAAPLLGLKPILGGGSGALAYRADIDGQRFVLRMEGTRIAHRNSFQYVCMQAASDAGIAPRLRHLNATAGVVIMDFVASRPLRDYPGGAEAMMIELGALTRRLQATALFPYAGDYPVVLTRMLENLRSVAFAPGLLDAHADGFARIVAAYRWDSTALVSAHNDLNAGNILFDGERLWLVDWETAFRNDPLADVAILVENFGNTPALADRLLTAWLGHEADRALRARLLLMTHMTRLYYACLIFSGAGAGGAPVASLDAPTRAQFWADAAAGKRKASDPETVRTLGKIYLAAFMDGLSTPAFAEAIKIAGG